MPDEVSDSNGRSWRERLSQFFSSGPSSREELSELVRSLKDRDIIDHETHGILEGGLQVAQMQARDVMIPRSQMIAIKASASPKEFLPIIIDTAHSRFPVLGDDPDEIIGIMLAKDLLPLALDPARMERFSIKDHLRRALVIPESKRLDSLLRDFRISRNHMAVVVDEYGGVAGLVTIEDVLEQIVGEIGDEHDEAEDVTTLSAAQADGQYVVDALTPIEDFNERFGADFDDDEYDTIGGLVTAAIGHLPDAGEELTLGRFGFRVARADARRLHALHVSVHGE